MKSRNIRSGLPAASGMLVLILDTRRALEGMRDGIGLCLEVLIPSLFPFFILSIWMTGNLVGADLRFLRPVGRLCGVPAGAESLLVTGFLGGYPVGAQNVALARRRGQLSEGDARHMLRFCSNAGPAFFFGMIGQAFDSAGTVWLLWSIHLVSALLTGLLSRSRKPTASPVTEPRILPLSVALKQAVAVMAQVCGWVVLFRTLLSYLEGWLFWALPAGWQTVAAGLLELANGCVRLRDIASAQYRFLASAAVTALGGLCVTLQTLSVTDGLSLRPYLRGKLMQTCLSLLLAWVPVMAAVSPAVPVLAGLVLLILVILPGISEKNSSFPAAVGV